MNCISSQRIACAAPDRILRLARRVVITFAVCLAACGAPASEPQAREDTLEYSISYRVTALPNESSVRVELDLSQGRRLLREMRFDADRVSDLHGDGDVAIDDGRVRWLPPDRGGKLSWRASVSNRRNGDGYDAWLGPEWGLFRAEDIIPRAATRTLKGATSRTNLTFRLPRGWSVVTEYRSSDGSFEIDKPERRFVQPSGWMVMGELGVRRDRIAGVRVAIAAPENQQARRLDMLAMLNWTLPELARIVPRLPERLTIVSAGEPMWRGALSGPQSIFLHAERPLISENGTSTLLHELIHVTMGTQVADGNDWILEGLAEYYSIELLGRSGTLTRGRYESAFETLEEWSQSADALCGASSSGPSTALAVVTLRTLDVELKATSAGEAALDDVVRQLLDDEQAFTLSALQSASAGIIGKKPDALHIDRLPGCRTLADAETSD